MAQERIQGPMRARAAAVASDSASSRKTMASDIAPSQVAPPMQSESAPRGSSTAMPQQAIRVAAAVMPEKERADERLLTRGSALSIRKEG